jgi:hypothetical protein
MMEKTFGVICEGPSDYRILKRIVEAFFKGDDPAINCYQPKQLPSGKSDYGGWPRVLECCADNTLKEIFEYNDYAIIQIDTDCSQDTPFNVPHLGDDGQQKSHEQLCVDVIERLTNLISQPEIQANQNRILFAICIHSIECWLLPIVYSDNKKENTINCIYALNRAVQQKYKGMVILKKSNKNEYAGIKVYDKLISDWKRKDDILASSQFNYGFKTFIQSLDQIQINEA